MAKKEFKFRGKSVEELKTLSIDEFAELLPSRERRTMSRGLDESKKKLLAKLEKKDKAKTHEREMIIFPTMVGKVISVHNGKEFVEIHVIPEMIGMRLGQLVLTRKRLLHSSPGVGATKSSAAASVR